jgi:hypothetical protein
VRSIGLPIIVLNLPGPVPALISQGRHVVKSVKASQKLQSVWAVADQLNTDLDTLQSSEALAKKGGEGAVDQRNVDEGVVRTDFELVRAGVLAVAAKDPANAEVIVAESGLDKKKKGGHTKTGPEVTFPGGGAAHVYVKSVKRRASYEWQISLDGGKTFVPAGTTTRADQIFTGLTAGTTYYVRWKTTIGRITSDWGQTFVFMMH